MEDEQAFYDYLAAEGINWADSDEESEEETGGAG